MEYTDREALYVGADYPENAEPAVELDVLDLSERDEDGSDSAEEEAALCANRIEELMSSFQVWDGGGSRPLRYGDIAILMRSPRSRSAAWLKVFRERGIPLSFDQEDDFFETPEINIALAFAAVIDNPRQDIPLITVLRSPVYGFTSEELGNIRSMSPDGDYYSALEKAAEKSGKCRSFLAQLKEFRALSPNLPADELLWQVFTRTELFAAVSAMPGGDKRLTNLMSFIDCARRLESGGFKGVFGFVDQMLRMKERGASPVSKGLDKADAVIFTSIHRSKGLEYPVVFLADTAHQFNQDDLKKPLLIHPELGVGPRVFDKARKVQYPSVMRLAVRERIRFENLSEEMRVLYVAMTRAREKLIILCSMSRAEDRLAALSGSVLPVMPEVLEGARSQADFILLPALRRAEAEEVRFGRPNVPADTEDPAWDIRLVKPEGEEEEPERAEEARPEAKEEDVEAVRAALSFRYPYLASTRMPSKLTATEMKGTFASAETHEDADELKKARRRLTVPVRPELLTGGLELTAAQKGTAAHRVMQYADYRKCQTREGARAEIERLYSMGNLSKAEAESVKPVIISDFFSSPLGERVLSADKIWRELKFSTLVDSDLLTAYPSGEKLLLQGVVDCCIEKDGSLTVIDFKTDHVTSETVSERGEYYRGQLEAYAYAMEKIIKKPVSGKYLYFLTAGMTYEL